MVIEELDPFIEEQVKAMGLKVTGKELFSLCGELSPGRIRRALEHGGLLPKSATASVALEKLPPRPPNMYESERP